MAAKANDVLTRAKAKQAALDEIYAQVGPPEPGKHKPLTPEQVKVQRANALSVAELEALQRELYGQWVAVADIYYDGVLAFAPGHAVPTTHVEAYGYEEQGLVERVKPAASNG